MTEIEFLREENILLKREILELKAEIASLKKQQTWHYTTEYPIDSRWNSHSRIIEG
jgi:hypothetical protein